MDGPYDFDLDPVSFITVGTVGPPGQRTFYFQAARERQVVALLIEKEHAAALSVSLKRLLEDLERQDPEHAGGLEPEPSAMALLEPVEPRFRVDSIGIGVDAARHMVVLVMGEPDGDEGPGRRARFVASYGQVLALAEQAAELVRAGRPVCALCGEPMDADGHFCPPRNGHARPPA